jgi:hypothetical protein
VESLERELTSEREEVREAAASADRLRRNWRIGVAVAGIAVLVLGGLGVRLQQLVDTRMEDASARVAAAERQAQAAAASADREIASARAETTAARDAAARAALVSDVLTAPDLLRFGLTGTGDAEPAVGQAMWSRSRGLIVSVSRLPPAASGFIYQTWLWSNARAIRAGELTADATGRATLVVQNPPDLPRPINGVTVTLEPVGDQTEPSGAAVLVRAVAVNNVP